LLQSSVAQRKTAGEGGGGVGRATTEAVVYASITILISNFFLTWTLDRLFHLHD